MGFTRVATRIISPFGYRVVKIDSGIYSEKEYYLHTYKDKIGNFDHEHYMKIQTNANRKKINNIWAREEDIATISDYIKSRFSTLEFGICHGTRRGLEQKWFSKFLDCSVIGTEISDTAEEFDNTVQWDFHEVKAEWIGKADFIYSNSLDHSYDPEKALNSWIS